MVLNVPLPASDMSRQVSALLPVAQVSAGDDDNVRRTPAMRQNIHKHFSRIRDLADEGKLDQAFEALERLGEGNLNSYERAMRWNLAAFLHHQQDDIDGTARAYHKLLEQPELPLSLEQDTLYSLARAEMIRENYDEALTALGNWFDLKDKPGAQAYAMKAQLLYQNQDWDQALGAIDQAIDMQRAGEGEVRENWYLLKRGIHYQQNDYEGLRDVLEILVRDFTKASYLNQLSAVYGELGNTAEQLAVREAAYEKGYLDKESELVGLAQLLVSQDNPYKAAQVMRDGIDNGVVEATESNLKRMGDNYLLAKEYDEALAAFENAAKKTDNGELHLRMAQVSADLGRWEAAADYATIAIKRGDFERQGRAHVVSGVALFNQDRLSEALDAFAQARDFEDTENMADQWHDYVSREQQRRQALEAAVGTSNNDEV
jgi:tetratricopeptide (TPR) repeat protein